MPKEFRLLTKYFQVKLVGCIVLFSFPPPA